MAPRTHPPGALCPGWAVPAHHEGVDEPEQGHELQPVGRVEAERLTKQLREAIDQGLGDHDLAVLGQVALNRNKRR